MRIANLLSLGSLLALSVCARAGVVSGRVVDALGNGIAGVNLDFKPMSGGGSPTVLNDGTDANGYFATTVTPSNNYRVTFVPPAPPASTSLILEVDDIVVTAGATNVGTVALPEGVALSGRCVNTAGAGVGAVNVDVLDSTGSNVQLTNDFSDAAGYFSLAIPSGAIELRFDTTPVVGPLLAPRSDALNLSGAYAAGDVVLQPGYALSALVKRQSNNTGVLDCDVDIVDGATGQVLYTPGDNSDATGFVDVIVPAGTFDIRFTPLFADHLVGVEFANHVVSATTFLGTILLQPGVVLAGTVSAFDGSHHGGVDVDVKYAATGVGVFLGHDNTDAAGFYQVIAPTGTFNVTFSPPLALPYGAVTYSNVVIATNKTQNGTLPSCPFFTTVGTGITGLGGFTPLISASGGAPRIGNLDYGFQVAQGRGGSKSVVVFSLGVAPNPLPAPRQVVPPMSRRYVQLGGALGTPGAGSGGFAFPIAQDPLLAGQLIRAWFYVRDGSVAGGLSATNELRATVCP